MSKHPRKPVIAIYGAGLVGCYVGGMLASDGSEVQFFGRRKPGDQITKHGMTLSSFDLPPRTLQGDKINWSTNPEDLAKSSLVLVCVKSADTGEVAKLIRRHCDANATIFSLQNGVGNTDILRKTIKTQQVLGAMVGFNIVRFDEPQLRFHRATEGEIILQSHPDSTMLRDLLVSAGIGAKTVNDIQPVFWGKLVMNLNNAVNVLSGLPLKQQLENRTYRKILALCIEEAVKVMKAAGIHPARIGKVKPEWMPGILRLPDFLFKILASGMLKIDENARSSMWEDLQAGRRSEVDYLNGAICQLGARINMPTPVNDFMVDLVHKKFDNISSDVLSGKQMLEQILNLSVQPETLSRV